MDAGQYPSELSQFLCERLNAYKQNRESLLEPRWKAAYAAYRRRYDFDTAKKFLPAEKEQDWHSKAYAGWLKAKVVAGTSVVKDMLSRGGRLAFMMEPEALGEVEDPAAVRAAAAAHEAKIHEQLDKTDAVNRLALCIDDAGLYGLCWTERRFETVPMQRFVRYSATTAGYEADEVDMPSVDRVSPWEMYFDLEAARAADRLGAGVFRVRSRSPAEIAGYLGQRFFDAAAIQDAVNSAPMQAQDSPPGSPRPEGQKPGESEFQRRAKHLQEVIYWGELPLEIVEAHERTMGGAAPTRQDPEEQFRARNAAVECHVVMVEKRVIRFARTQRQERPYRLTYWEDSPDIPGGVSVADNAMDAQNSITGLMRMLINNCKQSAKVIWAAKKSSLITNPKSVQTGQVIEVRDDTPSIRDALTQLVTHDVSAGIERALNWVMQLGDLETMIPKTEQGQDGDYRQTMFEVAQRLERAGRYFGDILRRFDTLIADIVDWVYVNNLLDPEISPQLKQPFRIKALGFASFFNRIHRLNHLFTLLNLMLSKPEIAQISRLRWVLEEICKALDLDPDQVLKTPQEMEAEAAQLQAELDRQQAAPGGADPQQAALVQAQIDRLLAEAEKARAQASAVQDDARVKKAKAVFDLRAGGMPAAPRISAPMAGAAG